MFLSLKVLDNPTSDNILYHHTVDFFFFFFLEFCFVLFYFSLVFFFFFFNFILIDLPLWHAFLIRYILKNLSYKLHVMNSK